MPADAAEMAADLCEIRRRVAVKHRAGDRACEKTQNPAADDGVTDGDADRADERDHAEGAAEMLAAPLQRLLERADRAGAHGATKRHLTDDAAKAEPDDEDQKRHEKGKAAVLADAIRKEPDAAHADRRTNAGEDESDTALKTVAGFGSLFGQESSLLFCFYHTSMLR